MEEAKNLRIGRIDDLLLFPVAVLPLIADRSSTAAQYYTKTTSLNTVTILQARTSHGLNVLRVNMLRAATLSR
jgi:hypothetical protein